MYDRIIVLKLRVNFAVELLKFEFNKEMLGLLK